MQPCIFEIAAHTPKQIEVRSSVGINIDPRSTAGVMRSRIDDDQSCYEFFFRIILRFVQNNNLQTLTFLRVVQNDNLQTLTSLRVVQNDTLQTLNDDCPKRDELILTKNAKNVDTRPFLSETKKYEIKTRTFPSEKRKTDYDTRTFPSENRKNDCEKAENTNKNGLFGVSLKNISKISADRSEKNENGPIRGLCGRRGQVSRKRGWLRSICHSRTN